MRLRGRVTSDGVIDRVELYLRVTSQQDRVHGARLADRPQDAAAQAMKPHMWPVSFVKQMVVEPYGAIQPVVDLEDPLLQVVVHSCNSSDLAVV